MKKVIPSPKERIIERADQLFNSIGVHSTGIDRIIAESGVAKKTFYHHFPSKNDLIAEYFGRKDAIWFERLKRYSSNPRHSPLERVLGIFDGLKEWFGEEDFYGCPFIRGLSDFGEGKDDPRLVGCIEKHFAETQEYLSSLLKEVNPKEYKKLVPQMMSLVAGATIVAHVSRNPKIADINKQMARVLLSLHT